MSGYRGKLLTALVERSGPTAEIMLKGTCALTFIVVLPIIHPPTRQKWYAALRRRLA